MRTWIALLCVCLISTVAMGAASPCKGGACALPQKQVVKHVEKTVTVESTVSAEVRRPAPVAVKRAVVVGGKAVKCVAAVGKRSIKAVGTVVGVERRQARRAARKG